MGGEIGKCGAGIKPRVASFCVHHGEEPMISGENGSGTIFFSHCVMQCVYCQNFDISQRGRGRLVEIEEVASMMINLQEKGVHNINLVSPTHYAPQIMEALRIARAEGLSLPIVYNTGGYDSLELLREIEGEIDIFMPDFKYFDEEKAFRYSGVRNYVEVAREGVAEMLRQAEVLVRHLVLPNGLSSSKKVLDYLSSLSKDVWVSIMAQYHPQFRAREYPELSRRITADEYREAVEYARRVGLRNLYIQELESSDVYLPDFKKANPFGN
jgi:putative pyruvate formate lyase activating enzyme